MKVFILLFVTISTLVLASCGSIVCENQVLTEHSANDGAHIATVFERSCGAPSPTVTVVALHKSSIVEVEWVGDEAIHISFTNSGDQPTMREEWHGIRASYN